MAIDHVEQVRKLNSIDVEGLVAYSTGYCLLTLSHGIVTHAVLVLETPAARGPNTLPSSIALVLSKGANLDIVGA